MEHLFTFLSFLISGAIIFFLTRFINRREIKFYELAQMIETKIKDDEDITYDEILELLKRLSKKIHSRFEKQRFSEVLKLAEVKFQIKHGTSREVDIQKLTKDEINL